MSGHGAWHALEENARMAHVKGGVGITGDVPTPHNFEGVTLALMDNAAYRADLAGDLSNVTLGAKYGVNESTVRRHRAKLTETPTVDAPAGESESHGPGGSSYVRFSERAWGMSTTASSFARAGRTPTRSRSPGGGHPIRRAGSGTSSTTYALFKAQTLPMRSTLMHSGKRFGPGSVRHQSCMTVCPLLPS